MGMISSLIVSRRKWLTRRSVETCEDRWGRLRTVVSIVLQDRWLAVTGPSFERWRLSGTEWIRLDRPINPMLRLCCHSLWVRSRRWKREIGVLSAHPRIDRSSRRIFSRMMNRRPRELMKNRLQIEWVVEGIALGFSP